MWTWVPAFLAASLASSSAVPHEFASAAAFLVVAAGALAAVAGCPGRPAGPHHAHDRGHGPVRVERDRRGAAVRRAPAAVILTVVVVWGITVVADSAQFSTAISELAPAGTARHRRSWHSQTIVGFTARSGGDDRGRRFLALGPLVSIASRTIAFALQMALRGRAWLGIIATVACCHAGPLHHAARSSWR